MLKKIDWKKIWNFLKSKLFLISIIIVLISFGAVQCSKIRSLQREKLISEQNASALNESLKFEKLKNGNLVVSISGYIATEKELKTLNKDLWEKIKGQSGEIISLNHSIVQLSQDTTILKYYLVEKDKLIEKILQIDSNTYAAPWTLTYKYDSTNYDVFTGKTYVGVINKNPLELEHVNTELVKRLTQIDLVWGQKIEDKKLRVYIESKYPGFNVTQMQGVLLDPTSNDYLKKLIKQRHWFTGFAIGVGVTPGYDVIDQKFGLTVGPSIICNIYRF
jgi:hypothetical protein